MSTQQKSIRIGIVGGGPAGISTFLHLKNKLQHTAFAEHIELFIFEKGEKLGAGTPYASLDRAHLLNLSKIMMEPVAGEHHTFSQWLAHHDGMMRDSIFPPRHYFGEYLAFRANQAKQDCEKKGMKVNFLTLCPVLTIQEITQNVFEIVTQNKKYQVDYVILSTGHMPASNFLHLIGKPGYFHDPWCAELYERIHPESSVSIIGSRLTAIDIALKLQTMAHKGRVEMVSRGGLLPAVKGMPCSYSPQYLTIHNLRLLTKNWHIPIKLDLLLQLFWQEMSAGAKYSRLVIQHHLHNRGGAIDWLNREIREVQSGPRVWQTILACFYQLVSKLWPQLNLDDREQFLTNYFSLFATYNCAFPLESAVFLRQMMIDGQLDIHAGFMDVQFEDSQFIISLENKKTIKSSFVFNATGCGHDPEKIPLLKSMLDNKLLSKHSLGGINAHPSTFSIIDAKGLINPRIYALGDVVGGVCFYTIEITHMVQQANLLTGHLVKHLITHALV